MEAPPIITGQPNSAIASASVEVTGFGALFGIIQSGAPPGIDPPQKESGAGGAIPTQNAGAQELDLLPIFADDEKTVAPPGAEPEKNPSSAGASAMAYLGVTSWVTRPFGAPLFAGSPQASSTAPAISLPEIAAWPTSPVASPQFWPLQQDKSITSPLFAQTPFDAAWVSKHAQPPVPAGATAPAPDPVASALPIAEPSKTSTPGESDRLGTVEHASPAPDQQPKATDPGMRSLSGLAEVVIAKPPQTEFALGMVDAARNPEVMNGDGIVSAAVEQGLGWEGVQPTAPDSAPAAVSTSREIKEATQATSARLFAKRAVSSVSGVRPEKALPKENAEAETVTPEARSIPSEPEAEDQSIAADPDKEGVEKAMPRDSEQPLARIEAGAVKFSLPPRRAADILKQLADRIELLAAKPRGAMVIRLEPLDLGKITLTVRSTYNRVDAQISASNEHVRQALEQNAGQLGRLLEHKGLSLSQLDVGTQAAGDGHARHARQEAPTHAPRPTQVAERAPTSEERSPSARRHGGLDVLI